LTLSVEVTLVLIASRAFTGQEKQASVLGRAMALNPIQVGR
jgi:hypothetical protein